MLVFKDGDNKKDILGFRCDLCDHVTLGDVIPNEHGEFRYKCPKCGHHMKETTEKKEEETNMVNAYTVANAAKRLNCSTTTINRAIYDGRFHDCFTEIGYTGRPSWMIPSDQVEAWVTNGGFLKPKCRNQTGEFLTRKEVKEKLEKAGSEITRMPANYIGSLDDRKQKVFDTFKNETEKKPRMVFDPTVGKEVEVVNLFEDIPINPSEDSEPKDAKGDLNEFEKRVVRRVNKDKDKDCTKEPGLTANEVVSARDENGKPIAGRYPWGDPSTMPTEVPLGGDTDGDDALVLQNIMLEQAAKRTVLENFANSNQPAPHLEPIKVAPENPVVRTDGGFTITFPAEMIEDMVQKQIKDEIAGKLAQLRAAFDLMNEELKKLEEAIV